MRSLFDRLMSPDSSGIHDALTLDTLGRDIENLLNHIQLYPLAGQDPHLDRSVLNYGIPSIAGKRLDSAAISEIATQIELALIRFEPRLDSDSIVVRSSSEAIGQPGVLMITVESFFRRLGEVRLRMNFDMQFGNASVVAEMIA